MKLYTYKHMQTCVRIYRWQNKFPPAYYFICLFVSGTVIYFDCRPLREIKKKQHEKGKFWIFFVFFTFFFSQLVSFLVERFSIFIWKSLEPLTTRRNGRNCKNCPVKRGRDKNKNNSRYIETTDRFTLLKKRDVYNIVWVFTWTKCMWMYMDVHMCI